MEHKRTRKSLNIKDEAKRIKSVFTGSDIVQGRDDTL